MPWTYVPPSNVGTESESRPYWYNTDTREASLNDPTLVPSAENLWGWNPNMAVPAGGFTVGQALAPNYLSQGTTLDDPAALAAAVRDVAPGYNGPLDMNAVIPPDQMRAPAKDNGFENLLGMGAMAGLGYLSGGFGLSDLWSSLSNTFNPPSFSGTFDPSLPTGPIAGGAAPTQVGGWEWSADPRFTGTTVDGVLQNSGNPNWWQTDWGTEGLVDLGSSGYNAVAANDPIGELIKQLDSGKSSADALKAVESALPGTTRSALEQFLFEAGGNASNLLKSGASQLFGGSGTGTDGFNLSKLLGAVGPGIGGYLASNAQADAYRDIANKQLGEGQWARDMLKQSYADPNAYLQREGKPFLDDAAKRQAYALSTGGNPIGSGNQMTQMMSDAYARNAGALGTYRGGLTSAGYGVPYQAGSQAQMNAVGQQGAGYNALGSIGSGINDIFNPKPTAAMTLADLLKQSGIKT